MRHRSSKIVHYKLSAGQAARKAKRGRDRYDRPGRGNTHQLAPQCPDVQRCSLGCRDLARRIALAFLGRGGGHRRGGRVRGRGVGQ